MNATPVTRTLDDITLELATGDSRLVVRTDDPDVWVVLRRSSVAGDAFDPARWLLVSDAAGPVGVVLPQPYPDEPGTGSLFYIGVMPDRRGAGHGARLHLLGLHELAARGCTRYVGSTDERNPAMVRIFERNGARATGTQSFYAPA